MPAHPSLREKGTYCRFQLAGRKLALRRHMMTGRTQLITFRQPRVVQEQGGQDGAGDERQDHRPGQHTAPGRVGQLTTTPAGRMSSSQTPPTFRCFRSGPKTRSALRSGPGGHPSRPARTNLQSALRVEDLRYIWEGVERQVEQQDRESRQDHVEDEPAEHGSQRKLPHHPPL